MGYLACLHCETPLEGRKHFCNQLCKSAEAKRLRKLRASDDAHWATVSSQPTFDLTDVECYQIEAAVASQEQHVFDGNGFRVKAGQQEQSSANDNELHESWANKGADLDVWQLRRADRERFGGIVVTDAMLAEMELVKMRLFLDQPLETIGFHRKLFAFEVDEMYDLHLRESDQAYDRDLLNAV